MFEWAKDFIRQVIGRMFPKKNIEDALKIKIPEEPKMIKAIQTWRKMYEDKPEWLDDLTDSQNLSASIANEIARLVTLEFESEIVGKQDNEGDIITNKRAEYLNKQYQKHVMKNIRTQVEYACALGGMVFKPYIDGEEIAIDFVQADEFIPVRFNSSGELVSAVFPDRIKKGDTIYTRLEFHDLLEEGVYIKNVVYASDYGGDEIGYQVPLNSVEEWKDLNEEGVIKGVKSPLFAYFKIPQANTIDSKSNLGVSVFEKARKLIKQADKLYSTMLWEYEASEKAILIDREFIRLGQTTLPKGKERLFLKVDGEDGFYEEYSPEIRSEPYFDGLNKLLQKIEFNCGLAYGTLSDVQTVDKTATEIKASKQRTYSTVLDVQSSLKDSLSQLIKAMNVWADISGVEKGEYGVSFDFDDSLAMDTETEHQIMLQEVAAEILKPEIYLMKRYGVTEEQAREMMPNMADVMGEGEDDGFE